MRSSASSLGVLTSDSETPVVSETSVSSHSLESLNIVSELGVQLIDEEVRVLAIDNISLSVQKPTGNLVLQRVLNDSDDSLELFNGQFTGSLGKIDISLLADEVGISSTNTLDGGKSVHDLDLTVHVSGKQTQNVLKVALLSDDERHCSVVEM